MTSGIKTALTESSYSIYTESVREIGAGRLLCVVRKDDRKYVCLGNIQLNSLEPREVLKPQSGGTIAVYALSWDVYQALRRWVLVSPVPCSGKSSFGTGDRMGMVTAAHLHAHRRCPIFPILAQQSPRELERTGASSPCCSTR